MAEKERGLRRTGEIRTDELLSLKKSKQLKPKINPSLRYTEFKNNKSFQNPRPVRVPVFATTEQSRAARALGYTPIQLLDALARQAASNQLGTVKVVLRDGTIAQLPRTLPRVESAARRYVEAWEKEARAAKQRHMEEDARLLARFKPRQIQKLEGMKKIPFSVNIHPKSVPIVSWNTLRAGTKPLRRGKR